MTSILKFCGGAGFVSGANFLLDTGTLKIMLDCGLVQGSRFASSLNTEPFPYNPAEVDVLFVTHAHMDHIGRIPKLVKDGFAGKIFSSEPTRDLAPVMFKDALKIMREQERKYGIKAIYDENDIEKSMRLWHGLPYGETLEFSDLKFRLENAGHILGSAMIFLERGEKRLVYTGDLGNPPEPFLPDRAKIENADYLLIESVYGDRFHENKNLRSEILKESLLEAQRKNKTVLIPAFSLERSQILLLEINNMIEKGELKPMKVYLDSPLAISVSEIFEKYVHLMRKELQEQIKSGDDIFDFPFLKKVRSHEESLKILKEKGAKVIIAGSGMSSGGRVLAHEKKLLQDKNAIVLFVGYQGVGTLGRKIQEGVKKLEIEGKKIKVSAKIKSIRGFSAHADRDELLKAVSESADSLKRVFVVLGEMRSSLFLAQRIHDYLGLNSFVPKVGEESEIDF